MAAGPRNRAVPVGQLLFFAAAAASLLLSMGAAIAVLREPGLRFRPFWAIVALVGVGGGAMVVAQPGQVYWFFGIALPTVSFAAADDSWNPELVRALFPAGALVVLVCLRHRRARRSARGNSTS